MMCEIDAIRLRKRDSGAAFPRTLVEGVVALAVERRNVTIDNWEECIALRVSEAQRGTVAPNVYSIAQAKVQPECVPLAIYAENTPAGFLMYALDRDDGKWWIYRLMIDERYQGRGYGRATLNRAIDRLRQEPGCTRIMISLKPDNWVARALYQSVGVVETGQQIGGEDVHCPGHCLGGSALAQTQGRCAWWR